MASADRVSVARVSGLFPALLHLMPLKGLKRAKPWSQLSILLVLLLFKTVRSFRCSLSLAFPYKFRINSFMPTELLSPLMEMALKLCCPHKDQSLPLAPTEMPGGNGLPATLEFRRWGIPWASSLIRLAQSVSSWFKWGTTPPHSPEALI